MAERAAGRALSETGWMDPLALADRLEVPDYKLGVLLVVQDALEDAASKVRTGEE